MFEPTRYYHDVYELAVRPKIVDSVKVIRCGDLKLVLISYYVR